MDRRRFGALVTFVAVAVMALVPMRALACSCIVMTTQERVEFADVIFAGRVEKVEPSAGGSHRGPTVATLAAETVWKGPVQIYFDVEGGSGGGADCTVSFEVGETYLVFATGDPGAVLSTSICNGTALLSQSEDIDALGPGTPVAPDVGVIPVPVGGVAPDAQQDVAEGHVIRDPGNAAGEPQGSAGAEEVHQAQDTPATVTADDAQLIAAPAEEQAEQSRTGAEVATVAGALGIAVVGGLVGWFILRRRRAA